jgi:hypothetical protein
MKIKIKKFCFEKHQNSTAILNEKSGPCKIIAVESKGFRAVEVRISSVL